MKKLLLLAVLFFLAINLKGQEYGKKFVDIYVNINNQDPKTFKLEDDTVTITSPVFNTTNFYLDIQNNTDELFYIDFNKSYFVLGGKTSDVIPGETYLKDLNLQMKKTKIAPDTKVSVNLFSRERNNDFNPLFSSKQAHKAYKADKFFLTEKLVSAFENEIGEKFKREFTFEVRAMKLVNELKKGKGE